MCKWLPSVDRNDNALIISTTSLVVSSGIKKYFWCSTKYLLPGLLFAFKQHAGPAAGHKCAFKHQQHRLYRLLYLQFAKMAENSTDKTDETIYTGGSLSSAVAYVEFAPSGSLGGVFFGRYLRDLLNDHFCAGVVRV